MQKQIAFLQAKQQEHMQGFFPKKKTSSYEVEASFWQFWRVEGAGGINLAGTIFGQGGCRWLMATLWNRFRLEQFHLTQKVVKSFSRYTTSTASYCVNLVR